MPNVLALDTSSDYCSVSLYSKGKLTSTSELAPRSHTQLLLPMAKKVIENSSISLEDLDAVAFGCGPGSFTGLRIAAGVAQGLAYGLNCSILPISNLQAMALQHYRQHGKNNILVAFDARMGEVYWSVCQVKVSDQMVAVDTCGNEQVSAPETLFLPDEFNGSDLVGVGSGFSFLESFPSLIQQRVSEFDVNARPQAEAICELALSAMKQGITGTLADAVPSYIRDKVTWQKLPGRE